MWRPVALSAFLALLFMSSRSGQQPAETNPNEAKKTDFGVRSADKVEAPGPIIIDPARSSVHPKSRSAPDERHAKSESPETTDDTAATATDTAREEDKADASGEVRIADLDVSGKQTIPLPTPKTGSDTSNVRVVVTQGEQKTALTSDEEALSLMPQGPDFAAKVQNELARLGCYGGQIDNIWGPMSRNAVGRFNRVARSKIPLKQPTRALLSAARKAPDGYCRDGGKDTPKVASLEPSDGLEALKERPEYLPPWMRGEGMPAPDENKVASEPESETSSQEDETRSATRSRARENAARERARRRAEQRRTRRQRAERRRHRRSARRSFGETMDGRGAFWPGQ